MFSRSSGYAIQALTYLAGQPSGKLVGAREMATTLEIPMPFLWKILRKLSQKRLVRSFKGVRGGYELARPARSICVAEVLAAGRNGDQMAGCILGLNGCDEKDPCALHSHWKTLRTQIEGTVRKTTLADLVRDSKRFPKRKARTRNGPGKAASQA